MYLKLLSLALPFVGIRQLSESASTPVKEKKYKAPPRPSYSRKRQRAASGFSSGLGDKSPTKSAKIESDTSDPISIETIRDDPVIPSEREVVSLLSDSPKQKGAVESSVIHHVTKPTSLGMVFLEFDKNTTVHSGYDSVHKECSKLFFSQDRKVVVSMKAGGSEHVHSREALKVNLLPSYFMNHLGCLV